MKLQYLGDSKDSFKWDYHHFLVESLGYERLQIAWMMTPDDHGPDGATPAERFPARPEILSFCNKLRQTRDPVLLSELPAITHAPYAVSLYKSNENLANANRDTYFSGIEAKCDQVVFLDPDNGFEPEKSFTGKHVRYAEVERVLKMVSPSSVITVFQHHRRRKFPDDFARIRQRLHSGSAVAIYWHSLMFVSISSSPEAIRRVDKINCDYARLRPVDVLA